MCSVLYLGIWDPYPHLIGQPSRRRLTRCNAPTAGPYNAIPSDFLRDDLRAALVSNYLGSVSSALLPGLERLPIRNTLAVGFAKFRATREYDGVSLFAITPEWDKQFLETSMAHSTMEAHESVRRDKKQKAATTLLRRDPNT